MSNREVAAELYLSVKTVESRLSGIFAKLGIHPAASCLPSLQACPRDRALNGNRSCGDTVERDLGPSPRDTTPPRLHAVGWASTGAGAVAGTLKPFRISGRTAARVRRTLPG